MKRPNSFVLIFIQKVWGGGAPPSWRWIEFPQILSSGPDASRRVESIAHPLRAEYDSPCTLGDHPMFRRNMATPNQTQPGIHGARSLKDAAAIFFAITAVLVLAVVATSCS